MSNVNSDNTGSLVVRNSPVPIRKYAFCSNFVFGASTSAYQIEGSTGSEHGCGPSIWEPYFAQRPHLQSGAIACDHYGRMEEDVRMMKQLGLKAYRFSISWPRVIPLGRGAINEKGLAFYDRLVDALLRNGIEPYVTLYHWDLPQALEDNGGWLNRDTAVAFAEFSAVIAHRLGDRVKYFGTLNEPEVIVAGYTGDGLAPGYSNPALRVKVAHHLMLAHGLSVQTLRAINKEFKVGVTLNLVPAEPSNASNPGSVAGARTHWLKNYALYLEAIFKARYPEVVLAEAAATGVEIRSGDMEIISQPIGYLGVNWYLRHVVDENGRIIDNLPGALTTQMGWEMQAPALTRMLVKMNGEYNLPPIYITENGAALDDEIEGGRIQDVGRMTYIHEHLNALESATAAGVNIAGYFAWSLMDNLEWSLGFEKTFGIVHVDRSTLKRTVKDSGIWYRDMIKANKGASLLSRLVASLRLKFAPKPTPTPVEVIATAAHFPTVSPDHTHALALLENAMRFLAPDSGTIDAKSGYPFEGWNWNANVAPGVNFRTFTQLTAIGKYMEVLADVVAGQADSVDLSRQRALKALSLAVRTLRCDQRDDQLAAKGLLVNFMGLDNGKRLGHLTSDVKKATFVAAFGEEKGAALWTALQLKGWLKADSSDSTDAIVIRGEKYGWNFFDGELTGFAQEDTRRKVMAILDQRIVLICFGDNANLTTSVAHTIGALLTASIADQPEVARIRGELEAFLNLQKEGYQHLYDPKAGLFYFGWDATRDRLIGWSDAQGNFQAGYMDYFVNEFRAPAVVVAALFELPVNAVGNLGFKMKAYTKQDGEQVYALAPWDGSAFQSLGLGLAGQDMESPSWRQLLKNAVAIHCDFSSRRKLPGFLSECYTGDGMQYTGAVGIPDIACMTEDRITHAASLYCLGVAYTVSPVEVENFLAANWTAISALFTSHGPWEGHNLTTNKTIDFQTTAHTLSLAVGILATGPANMKRYADYAGISAGLSDHLKAGTGYNFLSGDSQIFAWTAKDAQLTSVRNGGSFSVNGDKIQSLGLAFVTNAATGADLSGCKLRLSYRSTGAMAGAVITLKPVGIATKIPKEIVVQLVATEGGADAVIEVPLPAMVGLAMIKEVVITHTTAEPSAVGLTITGLDFVPVV